MMGEYFLTPDTSLNSLIFLELRAGEYFLNPVNLPRFSK